MTESEADSSVYPPFCPDLSVRAIMMYLSRQMLTQMATLSASGVWADTCPESLIVGQLELHRRHPVSPTKFPRPMLMTSHSGDRRRSA
jgi:hypothetical protein